MVSLASRFTTLDCKLFKVPVPSPIRSLIRSAAGCGMIPPMIPLGGRTQRAHGMNTQRFDGRHGVVAISGVDFADVSFMLTFPRSLPAALRNPRLAKPSPRDLLHRDNQVGAREGIIGQIQDLQLLAAPAIG